MVRKTIIANNKLSILDISETLLGGKDLFSMGGKKKETAVAKVTLTKVKMFSCWKFIHPSDVSSCDKNPFNKK